MHSETFFYLGVIMEWGDALYYILIYATTTLPCCLVMSRRHNQPFPDKVNDIYGRIEIRCSDHLAGLSVFCRGHTLHHVY